MVIIVNLANFSQCHLKCDIEVLKVGIFNCSDRFLVAPLKPEALELKSKTGI